MTETQAQSQTQKIQTQKPAPSNFPRLSSSLFYDDAAAAIDFICRAFGFELRLKVEGEGGRIEHSELTFGEAIVMVGTAGKIPGRPDHDHFVSPRTVGGTTQAVCLYLDDADAHAARARAAGAVISMEPKTSDYGPEYWEDRGYQAIDPEGHVWWFVERRRG